MKTYISDIIPRIQRFSQKLDDLTKLTNQHWVSLGDINEGKRVFIFRTNNQLLISENGIVEIGSWEYLGNQSLLLNTKHESYLLKHGFFDENVIALKLDNSDSYAFFINETKYNNELNTIEDISTFLENRYANNVCTPIELNHINRRGIIAQNGISYEIANEEEIFISFNKSYIIYLIKYSGGLSGPIYKNKSTEKYFYTDNVLGKLYCKSFDDVINKLFQTLKRQNNR